MGLVVEARLGREDLGDEREEVVLLVVALALGGAEAQPESLALLRDLVQELGDLLLAQCALSAHQAHLNADDAIGHCGDSRVQGVRGHCFSSSSGLPEAGWWKDKLRITI